MARRPLPISRWWVQLAILTYVIGFTILGILAYLVYQEQPPIPGKVVDASGRTIFTRDDVFAGMNVFQRYGVMQYGSVYGHGAYLGPDFTADYLHRQAENLTRAYELETPDYPSVGAARVRDELHANTYDEASDTLIWSDARAKVHEDLVEHYIGVFDCPTPQSGMQAHFIRNHDEIRALTAFFAWTASANRPGKLYSYTNNWPPEEAAGNVLTADALTWSAVSIIGLLGGTGIILYLFGRYDWLGWTARKTHIHFRPVGDVVLAPAQRAIVWFLVIASLLFLVQTLLGGLLAHYRADPDGFYSFDLSHALPYNLARTWHVQLSIFWVVTAYLATGIFMAPLIAGHEPKGQSTLSIFLLAALTLVVVGSLAGEAVSIFGWFGDSPLWHWLGHQGWEYLDLGRLWQILLTVGLFVWVLILFRGLRGPMGREGLGNMPWLLFYAALALPVFYAAGLLTSPKQGFVITDFWRFWVVHLWVEDFLELFTTIVVAYMFVLLGMVRETTGLRVIYLDMTLYGIGGVVGTMHHLYFSGAPVAHMALGATFSALEVIPLLLLTLEAWGFIRSGERSLAGDEHPHRWAVWFLIAVGVWNFFGAGVFGFLINLPVVSYYQIGTNLTANHAHTAMMGVYGMLAIGLLLFCLRYLTRPDKWNSRMAGISFWSLNLGLLWMSLVNLFPVGIVQLHTALADGYWQARSPELFLTGWVQTLEWLRLPGDALFIVGGAIPLARMAVTAIHYPSLNRIDANVPMEVRLFTAAEEESG